MEKYYARFLKCISFLYIVIAAASQIVVTEKNISDSAGDHIFVTKINLTGINITKNGIYIDNLLMTSTQFINFTGTNLVEDETLEKYNSTEMHSNFSLVTREEWLAKPPLNELSDLELPSTRVIIGHTSTEECTKKPQCSLRVRVIQTFHMDSRGWDDIGYNFLVGGDGAVYEGRGWDKQGAHTKGYNEKSICIAFIGTFSKIEPTDGQLDAAKLLIQEGVKLEKLSKDYKLYGHRQLIPTESPGDVLYEIIQKWPHYSPEVKD